MACFLSELFVAILEVRQQSLFSTLKAMIHQLAVPIANICQKMRVGIVIPIAQIIFDIQAIQPRVIVPQKRKTF